MKNIKLLLFALLLPVMAIGQQSINNFDTASADTNYWAFFDNHGGKHYQTNGNATSDHGWIKIDHVTDPVKEGTGAMKLEYSAHNKEGWGGYTKLEHWHPDSTMVYDFSRFDSIMFWYYNAVPQSIPGRVHLRLNLHDVSNSPNGADTYDVGQTEYYYSFHYILDKQPGWNRIAMPLLDGRDDPDLDEWNGGAFNRTGWSGFEGNNVLDLDKIKGFSVEFSISGSGEGDFSAGTVILDHLALFAPSKKAFVFFNGKALPTTLSSWAWGQSSIEVAEGMGAVEGTNALKWVQGNEWGNGWTGMGFTISPTIDMSNVWQTDSLKFKMKAEPGTGPIRVQLEDGSAKVGTVFTPIGDNEYHPYSLKLSEMVPQDGTANFNPATVVVLGIMAEASGVAGRVIYITDMWTGNPKIDVVAPKATAKVDGIPAEYYNLVLWQDVPGESNEAYDVYVSEKPITDLASADVEKIAENILEGVQTFAHFIYYPLKDKDISLYYAVVCKDEAGNEGPFTISAAITNKAKGIATISLKPPANFVADGDVTEWLESDIKPFMLTPSESNWSLGTFTDDLDLTATCYLAMDEDNFYMAFDVVDNIYSYDPEGDFWQDDIIEFYIGLYNTTKKHNGFKRGAEPDYKFIILSDRLIHDVAGFSPAMYPNGHPNYNFTPLGMSDYVIEVKIPFDSLLVRSAAGDKRFHPKNGMKITMDINVHDSDSKNVREGLLSFSNIAKDNSWQGPQNWGYTWIGDTTAVATSVKGQEKPAMVSDYVLAQNYPNPFNPTTSIFYAIPKASQVKLEIYNHLGQVVKTLVNEYQQAGSFKVDFDAENLSSGVYFYRIQAGNYQKTMKMLLMR